MVTTGNNNADLPITQSLNEHVPDGYNGPNLLHGSVPSGDGKQSQMQKPSTIQSAILSYEEMANVANSEAGASVEGRPRTLTFGDDFDFSFPTNTGNLSSLLEQDINGMTPNITEQAAPCPQTVSSSSSVYNAEDGGLSQHRSYQPGPTANRTTTSSNHPVPSSLGSIGSASGFLSGLYNNGNNKNNSSGEWIVAHTPPSAFGTSYEARHFGKRARAGSISGRLRSASDLEDKGLIDRSQKEILKDLIISGDEALQIALDKYEDGDPSQLEGLIKSGALLNRRSSDADLLDDLDLDFLTVNDTAGTGNTGDSTHHYSQAVPQSQPIMMGRPPQPARTRSMPIPMKQSIPIHPHQTQNNFPVDAGNIGRSTQIGVPAHLVPPCSFEDDGIGDLEFNGDFGGATDNAGEGDDECGSTGSISTATQRLRSGTFGSLDINPPGALDRWVGGAGNGNGNGHSGGVPGYYQNKTNSTSDVSYNESSCLPTVINITTGMTNNGFNFSRADPRNNMTNAGESKTNIPGGIATSLAAYEADTKMNLIARDYATEATMERNREFELMQKSEQQKQERKDKKAGVTLKGKGVKKKDFNKVTGSPSISKQSKRPGRAGKTKDDDSGDNKETPSGLGRPRSMSDPNISTMTDADGLLHVERPDGWVGAYSPESRKIRIERFLKKRNRRVWTKKVKYDVRKNFADSRLRVKGRFVKKEDELLMRDLLSLT